MTEIKEKETRTRGVFLCSISPEDFRISVELGIYGNRFKKSKSGKDLRDDIKLSIIRDLIAIKPGDLVFLHVIEEQKIYGIFEITSNPFYSEEVIWSSQDEEVFPCRFCFKAYSPFENIIEKGKVPYITVSNLYEIIENEKIKSLISVEFEQNIERRGVRKLLFKDAKKIIKHFLYSFDFEKNKSYDIKFNNNIFNGELLKNKIFKVGRIENAIKAVILYDLSWQGNFFNILFKDQKDSLKSYDFANEVFISPVVRKLMDLYVYAKLDNGIEKHFVIEVKTNRVELRDLFQGLRYADLLLTLGWISSSNYEREVIIVGQTFDDEVKEYVRNLNTLYSNKFLKIRLIRYLPLCEKWASFVEEVDHESQTRLF